MYVPHELLTINWTDKGDGFKLSLPWFSMDVGVSEEDNKWIQDATHHLQSHPSNPNVQRFICDLKEFPVFYIQPRKLEDFKRQDLQSCTELTIDSSTPAHLISTFGCDISDELRDDIPSAWIWDREKILRKAQIEDTDLYDPLSFISYLTCYRLEWENTTWSGQDGFGQFLERLLSQDEEQFFQVMGWVVKQSWYITSEACQLMEPALIHFDKAKELIHEYICEELGHYKFMEQVFKDMNLNKEDFSVGAGTKWQLDAFNRTAFISPLAFSALINLFEASFYEGEDPIARLLRLSSNPGAAHGYDLHYKINQDNRHCDMPLQLAAYLAPQTRSHAMLTLGLFELTLNFFDCMEKDLEKTFKI